MEKLNWIRKGKSANPSDGHVISLAEPNYRQLQWMLSSLYQEKDVDGSEMQKVKDTNTVFQFYHYWNSISQHSIRGIHLPTKMHQRLIRKIYRFFRSSRYPPDYPPHLDNIKMIPNDQSQPVTPETDRKTFVHRKAKCSIPRNTKGAGRSKTQLLVRFANTVAEQTWINLSQEKPVSKDAGFGKERNLFQVADSSLNWPLSPQVGHLEFYRERFRGVWAKEQTVFDHRLGGGWYVCIMCSWAGRGCVGCGLSRHSVAFGAFLAWQLQCSGHCKASSSVPQKSMIRNKNNRFQLGAWVRQSSYFWF